MAGPSFLDANVILRYVLSDHPDHSPRAHDCFRRIARRELTVRTADAIIFEAAFTLERTYKVSRTDIVNALSTVLALPGVVLPASAATGGSSNCTWRIHHSRLPIASLPRLWSTSD